MANTNLDSYKTSNNKDWATWVKLVRIAHKEQGITLTQPQCLMIAKESYPGKGNVTSRVESGGNNGFNIPITPKDKIPANPPRRKRNKKPEEPPQPVYKREPEGGRPPKGAPEGSRTRRPPPRPPIEDEYSSEEESEESPERGRTRRPLGAPKRTRKPPLEDEYSSEEDIYDEQRRRYRNVPSKRYDEKYYSEEGRPKSYQDRAPRKR